jgi:hypothetical protein
LDRRRGDSGGRIDTDTDTDKLAEQHDYDTEHQQQQRFRGLLPLKARQRFQRIRRAADTRWRSFRWRRAFLAVRNVNPFGVGLCASTGFRNTQEMRRLALRYSGSQ